MLSFAGTMARFSGRAGDELYTALRDALVERRMPLSFLTTDAEEVSLDPHYVRCVFRSLRLLLGHGVPVQDTQRRTFSFSLYGRIYCFVDPSCATDGSASCSAGLGWMGGAITCILAVGITTALRCACPGQLGVLVRSPTTRHSSYIRSRACFSPAST